MSWDYCELNPLLRGTGSYDGAARWTAESIDGVAARFGSSVGRAVQADAGNQSLSVDRVVSTDPPYYDNIGYADVSDFFYVWLRRSLKRVFPDLFATLAVPKAEELVATPYRHGGKDAAETFFLDGMARAVRQLATQAFPGFPVTIHWPSGRRGASGPGAACWRPCRGMGCDPGRTSHGPIPTCRRAATGSRSSPRTSRRWRGGGRRPSTRTRSSSSPALSHRRHAGADAAGPAAPHPAGGRTGRSAQDGVRRRQDALPARPLPPAAGPGGGRQAAGRPGAAAGGGLRAAAVGARGGRGRNGHQPHAGTAAAEPAGHHHPHPVGRDRRPARRAGRGPEALQPGAVGRRRGS